MTFEVCPVTQTELLKAQGDTLRDLLNLYRDLSDDDDDDGDDWLEEHKKVFERG
jgi:hypothetical protein